MWNKNRLMEKILWISMLLLSVVSQGSAQCGRPLVYEDKMLFEKYAQRSNFKDGERVSYKCLLGYTHTDGSRATYCRNGQWEPLTMKCTRKMCGSAGEIENGYFDQQGNLFEDKAYAKCNKGYVLQGDPVRECLDSGWSGTIPTCKISKEKAKVRMECRPPKKVNMKFAVTKEFYTPGETVTASCDLGYQLIGRNTVMCQMSRKWNLSLLKCELVKCPKLKIPNGIVHSGVKFNTTVNITCKNGFQLEGANSVTCTADGSWTPAVPTCVSEKVMCPPPTVKNSKTENGERVEYSVGEHVTIVCEESFNLIGSPQITCGPNGQWQNVPECQSSTGNCVKLPQYPYAQLRQEYHSLEQYESGVHVRFRCNDGYKWTGGTSTILCENGHWTQLQMRCEMDKCTEVNVLNGSVNTTRAQTVNINTILKITCNNGFQLRGASLITCAAGGIWKPAVPTCVSAVRCPPPIVDNSEKLERREYSVGDRVTIVCENSFDLIGSSEITCGQNGQWQNVSECRSPTGKCGRFPYIPNAVPREQYFKQGPYESGAYVWFRCTHGYQWSGSQRSPRIRCENGRWTPLETTCQRKSCGSAGEILNGYFEYTGVSYGDTATAKCNEGYQLVGVGLRRCLAAGWDGRVPVCEDLYRNRWSP